MPLKSQYYNINTCLCIFAPTLCHSGNFTDCICIRCSQADSSTTEFLKRMRAQTSLWRRQGKQHINLWQLKDDITVEASCEETHCPTAQTERERRSKPDSVSLLPLNLMSQLTICFMIITNRQVIFVKGVNNNLIQIDKHKLLVC